MSVFLDQRNQLYNGPTIEAGPFVKFDSSIFTDLPGISILSPGSQLPDGSELCVDVLQGVWFWDANSIVPTTVTLEIQAPTVGLGYHLYRLVSGERIPLDQSVHGHDFGQTDFDVASSTYKMSFNLPLDRLSTSKWVLAN